MEKQINNPENWDKEIEEVERFLKDTTLPEDPIRINSYSTITDFQKFFKGHMGFVKANNGNKTYRPYMDRLIELKDFLIKNRDTTLSTNKR